MNKLFREDVRQVLSDQKLVEKLSDDHWAKGLLLVLIQVGVIRVEFYLKQRHMTPADYTEILREVEATYAERTTGYGDEGLHHRANESGIPERRPAGSVHDQVTRVLESHQGFLV